MAVEARHHMNLFPSQLITNRDFVKSNPGAINMNNNGPLLDTGLPFFNESAIMPETLLPFYQSLVCDNPTSINNNKFSVKNNTADSGLTYNVPPVVPSNVTVNGRKRPADPFNDLEALTSTVSQKTKFCTGLSSFVAEDVVFQIQQQQSEIDRFISEHNQKVRAELEERRKRQSRMLVNAIQEGVIKKLQEKDEELQRMGKLNWALQEKVKSLCMENQLWRDLAQTNEATANSLRTNLEQVLAHVSEERHVSGGGAAATALADDAESNCGSSDPPRCSTLAAVVAGDGLKDNNNLFNNRACRNCGERESSVLLLPCRHLCLCTLCGSTSVGTCPVCESVITASFHVNMS